MRSKRFTGIITAVFMLLMLCLPLIVWASDEVELGGLDIPEMGAPGYPDFVITKTRPEEERHNSIV